MRRASTLQGERRSGAGGHEVTARSGLHTTGDLVRLSGATFRQIDYWACVGLLSTVPGPAGSGFARKYRPEALDVARVLVAVSDLLRPRDDGCGTTLYFLVAAALVEGRTAIEHGGVRVDFAGVLRADAS